MWRDEPAEARARRYADYLSDQARKLAAGTGMQPEWCVVSGMASSRIGWKELPYAPLPFSLSGEGLIREMFALPGGGSVVLVSGLRAEADVMRGEEIEILGLALLDPSLASGEKLVVLPGTHSKHVWLKDGAVQSFATYMTGELFGHLHSAPTLRPCLERSKFEAGDEWFVQGVHDAASHGLAASLFKIRSRSLLEGVSDSQNSAFLSGLMIGAELARIPAVLPVHLAAGAPLAGLYAEAARVLGLNFEVIGRETLARAAIAAHRKVLEFV